jgi:hypothetical protein
MVPGRGLIGFIRPRTGTIQAKGTITPLEEDMPITDTDAKKIADTLLDSIRGEVTLGQFLTEYRGHYKDTIRVAEGIPDAILDRKRGSTLGELVNEYRGQHLQLVAAIQGIETGGTIDPAKLAAAIPASIAQDVANEIAKRLGGK